MLRPADDGGGPLRRPAARPPRHAGRRRMTAADGPVLAAAAAPAIPHRHGDMPWSARLVEQGSSFLPLLLMALLALGTWWLVKNTPLADAPQTAAPLRHE